MEITYNHEDGEPEIKKSMDIFNDNLGINIYKSVSGQVSADPTRAKEIILTAILTKINNGSAKRLTPENPPSGTPQTLIPTNSNNKKLLILLSLIAVTVFLLYPGSNPLASLKSMTFPKRITLWILSPQTATTTIPLLR